MSGKNLEMALWNWIINSGMKKLLTAITVFLAISSFFMMADDGQRLRNFLFIYDVDNINERMLDDADSTFGWLLDFGKGKSMVCVLDAECSVCIGQYMNFLSEYSDYIVSESAADAVPLVVLAKGVSLDILQYYLDENRSKFNSRASERLEQIRVILSENLSLQDGLFLVLDNKVVRYEQWGLQ